MATIIKTQINEKQADGSLRILHPETDASVVIESDAKQFISATEKSKLTNIETGAQVNTIESISVNGGDPIQPDANKNVNLTVAIDGGGVKLTYDATTGNVSLLDKDDTVLSTVDLPLELIVESGSYNESTKNIELILANGNKIEIPAGALVNEYDADGTTITKSNDNKFSIAQAILTRLSNVESKASQNEQDINNIEQGKVSSATTADKFSSNKTITINGDASGSVSTDFSTNPTLNIELANTGVTAGTYSAVSVDAKGRVTAGGQSIEVGTNSQTTPSSTLAVGGLFFKQV